jgi:peroxiredoxin Q/BCP
VGVSADPPEDLRKFHENLKLNFPLARDPSHGMLEPYGVWHEKNVYGAKKMGIVRTTCLLGEDGGVVRVFPRVRASGHIDEVLSALKSTRS